MCGTVVIGEGMDRGAQNLNPAFTLLTEENHEKPQSGWLASGFNSCFTTESPRSVSHDVGLLAPYLYVAKYISVHDFSYSFVDDELCNENLGY